MIDPTTTTAAMGQTARSIFVTELSDMNVSIANVSFPKYCLVEMGCDVRLQADVGVYALDGSPPP